MRRFRLRDLELILICDLGDYSNGAIVETIEEYLHGRVSYAHLLDGAIMRFREQIGTAEEMVWIGGWEPTPEPDPLTFFSGLFGPEWRM